MKIDAICDHNKYRCTGLPSVTFRPLTADTSHNGVNSSQIIK